MAHPETATPSASPSAPADPDGASDLVRFAAWAVYARTAPPREISSATASLDAWASGLAKTEVVLRGWYDVSGLRADADIMVWLHGPSADPLQAALRALRRTEAGAGMHLAWSVMGAHRPAEFSPDHVPSFMLGMAPLAWLCVYPFVRSYEWYLLPEEERREMLREHGLAGRTFAGVQANTVAAFALNDYEWILALESDDLPELMDLMRGLRSTQARRHVRVEVPFYTGRRVDTAGVVEVLR